MPNHSGSHDIRAVYFYRYRSGGLSGETSPAYPGWFPYDDEAVVQQYFEKRFQWYNNEHYHSRIGYVTPVAKHTGQAERIITERKKQLTAQGERRNQYWLSQPLTGDEP